MSPQSPSPRLAALVLTCACALAWGASVRNGFVWDDHQTVVEYPANRQLSGAATILTSADQLSAGQPTPYYRPLGRLAFLVDYQLFGLDPRGWHLENVLLHWAAACALFLLARRLLGQGLPALLAALLHALHPVNAEVVNLVSARNQLLATLLTLASCALHLRGRERASAAALFLAGLLCKETALMLLPVLGAWELAAAGPWRERLRRTAEAVGPFTLAALLYLGARTAVLGGAGPLPPSDGGLAQALHWNLHLIPKYLSILLFPADLTIFYASPEAYFASPWARAAAWLATAAAAALALRQGRAGTRFGLLWAAINYLPVSQLVPIPSSALAERFISLPAVGLWLVAADQVAALLARRPEALRPALAAAALLLAALATRSAARTLDWRDDERLFASAVRVEPGSALARTNHGLALAERGDEAGARAEWERAAALDPDDPAPQNQLGLLHAQRGELAQAEARFRAALRAREGDAEARFNLALALERTGRAAEAVGEYERFLRVAPPERAELVPRVRERVRRLRAGLEGPGGGVRPPP